MISVIVPIYGVEKYIRKCVESISAQNMSELEIILVDDGSPDECPKICDEYARKDGRIKVVHKENGGLVSARKAGLEASSGEYVGFVDGDDRIEPDMYSEFQLIIDKYAPDMIVSEYCCDFDGKTEMSAQCFREGLYSKKQLFTEIYPKILYSGRFYRFGISPNCWSKVFKKELLKKNLMQVDSRTRMGEDAAFTYPCMLDAKDICYINKPFYHYRIIASSMSRGYDGELEGIIMLPYESLKAANEKCGFDMTEQLNYYLLFLVNFLIRNEAKVLNAKSREQVKRTIKKIVKNIEVRTAVRRVRLSVLPVHTKIIVCFLRLRSVLGLYIYMMLFTKYSERRK